MKKNNFILFFVFCSCSIHQSKIIIESNYKAYMEIHNGNKLILADSVWKMQDHFYNFVKNTAFDFSDSIYIKATLVNGEKLIKKTKLNNSKYIYVELIGVEFNIIGTNRMKRNL